MAAIRSWEDLHANNALLKVIAGAIDDELSAELADGRVRTEDLDAPLAPPADAPAVADASNAAAPLGDILGRGDASASDASASDACASDASSYDEDDQDESSDGSYDSSFIDDESCEEQNADDEGSDWKPVGSKRKCV